MLWVLAGAICRSTVQHSTGQCSTVQYSTVLYVSVCLTLWVLMACCGCSRGVGGLWVLAGAAPTAAGFSASWARTRNVVPISVPLMGTFSGNTAHSHVFAGFRAYPFGYTPRLNATRDWPTQPPAAWVEVRNSTAQILLQYGRLLPFDQSKV